MVLLMISLLLVEEYTPPAYSAWLLQTRELIKDELYSSIPPHLASAVLLLITQFETTEYLALTAPTLETLEEPLALFSVKAEFKMIPLDR